MLSLNTNLGALLVQQNFNQSEKALNETIKKLSSGLRVDSGNDDPSSLAVAERLKSQSTGEEAARRGASDTASFLETGDAAMESAQNNLQRMREIAVQSKNGTLSASDKENLQGEFNALRDEVGEILGGSEYNGKSTTDSASIEFQGSYAASDSRRIDLTVNGTETAAQALSSGGSADITALDITANADGAMAGIDAASQALSDARAKNGAGISVVESAASNMETKMTSFASSRGRMVDADFAKETATMARANILRDASVALLGQANQSQNNIMRLLSAA